MSSAEEQKLLGNEALKHHLYQEAIDHYSKAIELNPSNAIYYSNRAQAEIKLDQYGAAVQDSTKSIELDADYIKAYYRRATANLNLLKYKEAQSDLKYILSRKPNDVNSKNMNNDIVKILKRMAFHKAIEQDSDEFNDPDYWFKVDLNSVPLNLKDYEGPQLEIEQVDIKNQEIKIRGLDQDFLKQLIHFFKKGGILPRRFLQAILIKINKVLENSPVFNEISMDKNSEYFINVDKFTVVGDVHGQFFDVINLFEINGFVSDSHGYLFNGDFVDRGSWSCEVIILLYVLKLMYPNKIYLNRGNHETNDMNKMYGFEDECKHKYGEKFFRLFSATFMKLPLITLLNNEYLIMHGGLFSKPDITIQDLKKSLQKRLNPKDGLEMDCLWSDPQHDDGYGPSKRGISIQFGPDITKKFLELNNLKGIIRSHEVRMNGYELEHNGNLITIFSAPNYCDSTGNLGAVINFEYTDTSMLSFKQFEAVEHPPIKPMAYSMKSFM